MGTDITVHNVVDIVHSAQSHDGVCVPLGAEPYEWHTLELRTEGDTIRIFFSCDAGRHLTALHHGDLTAPLQASVDRERARLRLLHQPADETTPTDENRRGGQ